MVDGTADVITLRPKLAVNNEKRNDDGSGGSVKDGLVMGLRLRWKWQRRARSSRRS